METSARLDPWAWISGAHQQYHYALLICMEVFANPNLPDADRIWACLDYVFEVPTHLTREQKGRWILTEVRDRTEIFANSRKVRAPAGYVDRLPQQTTPRFDEPNDSSTMGGGGVQRLNTTRVDLAQNFAVAEAMRNQYMPLQEAQGIHQANYYQPTNVPTQAAPMRDDRMVEIDWVSAPGYSIPHRAFGSRVFSMSGINYFLWSTNQPIRTRRVETEMQPRSRSTVTPYACRMRIVLHEVTRLPKKNIDRPT